MFVLCFVVMLVCCFLVDQAFHNVYITVGLAIAIGLTSGFFCAADERKQRERSK